MTDPQTPATEAGRRLLAEGKSWHLSKVPFPVNAAAIIAIEAEARADALREAAERVRALLDATDEAKAGRDAFDFDPDYYYGYDESLRAVLAILDPQP